MLIQGPFCIEYHSTCLKSNGRPHLPSFQLDPPLGLIFCSLNLNLHRNQPYDCL